MNVYTHIYIHTNSHIHVHAHASKWKLALCKTQVALVSYSLIYSSNHN